MTPDPVSAQWAVSAAEAGVGAMNKGFPDSTESGNPIVNWPDPVSARWAVAEGKAGEGAMRKGFPVLSGTGKPISNCRFDSAPLDLRLPLLHIFQKFHMDILSQACYDFNINNTVSTVISSYFSS